MQLLNFLFFLIFLISKTKKIKTKNWKFLRAKFQKNMLTKTQKIFANFFGKKTPTQPVIMRTFLKKIKKKNRTVITYIIKIRKNCFFWGQFSGNFSPIRSAIFKTKI